MMLLGFSRIKRTAPWIYELSQYEALSKKVDAFNGANQHSMPLQEVSPTVLTTIAISSYCFEFAIKSVGVLSPYLSSIYTCAAITFATRDDLILSAHTFRFCTIRKPNKFPSSIELVSTLMSSDWLQLHTVQILVFHISPRNSCFRYAICIVGSFRATVYVLQFDMKMPCDSVSMLSVVLYFQICELWHMLHNMDRYISFQWLYFVFSKVPSMDDRNDAHVLLRPGLFRNIVKEQNSDYMPLKVEYALVLWDFAYRVLKSTSGPRSCNMVLDLPVSMVYCRNNSFVFGRPWPQGLHCLTSASGCLNVAAIKWVLDITHTRSCSLPFEQFPRCFTFPRAVACICLCSLEAPLAYSTTAASTLLILQLNASLSFHMAVNVGVPEFSLLAIQFYTAVRTKLLLDGIHMLVFLLQGWIVNESTMSMFRFFRVAKSYVRSMLHAISCSVLPGFFFQDAGQQFTLWSLIVLDIVHYVRPVLRWHNQAILLSVGLVGYICFHSMIGQDDVLTSAFSLGIYTATLIGTVTTCVQDYIVCSLDVILLIHLMFTCVQPFLPEDIVDTVVPQLSVPTIAATGNVTACYFHGFFVGTFAQVVSSPLYAASSIRGHSLGGPRTDIGYRQHYLQNDCKSTRTSIKRLVYHAVMFSDPPDQCYLLLSSKLEHIFLQICITNNPESGSSSRSLLFLPLRELWSSSYGVSIFTQDLHCLNYFLSLSLCVLPSLISSVSINSTAVVASFQHDDPGDINRNVTMATRIVSMAAYASITQTRVSICYCLLSGCLYALTWNALGWDQFSETPAICLDSSIAGTINSYFGMATILVNLLWSAH